MSGIFYELQLLDTTLLYGQGFFVFMIFGFDNEIIFEPVLFKWVFESFLFLKLITFNILILIIDLKVYLESSSHLNFCQKLIYQKKLQKYVKSIQKNQRFHYTFYQHVFSGSDMVDWFISHNLVKNRNQGERLGRKLIEGRVIHHVTSKRDFYDGYHLYKFYWKKKVEALCTSYSI